MRVHAQLCLLETPWTGGRQAPQSVEFSRQEYWSVLTFPTPEDLSDPGIKLVSLASPALAGRFFTAEPHGKLWDHLLFPQICKISKHRTI